MSSKKSSNFSKLFDYFNGEEEDSEEEIENYKENYNRMIEAKNNIKESIETQNNNNNYIEEENQIITELYSNKEEDDDDNDVFYYKEKKLIKDNNDENDFDNFKFTSFKPKQTTNSNNNNENKNEENKKEAIVIENNDINQKNDLNNENNKIIKNEDIYKNIITEQCSFGNINDNFNRSTSLKTENNSEYKNNKIKEEYKPEYLINSKIFDELEKEEKIKEKKKKEIEWKDRDVLIKRNINKLKLYMKKNIKMKTNNKNKKPIELILYDDAIKKRKKEENINRNTITENELNSKRSKINKNSYEISMKHDEKRIESIIKKYSIQKENGLLLIDICLIFQELKIFRKLLENININKLEEINDINEFKNRISIVIKDNEIRKKKELELLEQTWNIINNDKNNIKNDIFEGFLKILFSSLGNINDTCNIMIQFIKAASFGEKLDDNIDDKIKECIKKFFFLKKNSVAYKNINNNNDKKFQKIIKEKEKNLTFNPNIEKNEYYKTNINKRRKNFNFNTLYDRFIKKEKDRQNNINKLKKEKIKEEMKEIKKKPKISKYITNNINQEEIHEKLYNQGNYMRKKRQEKIEEKEKEEKENLENELKTYKLNYNAKRNRKRMAKSFDISLKPKGYDEYIIRNRKEIINKEKLKEKMEKIPCGENYERIKRRTITPFNITDMRKDRKKEKKEECFIMKIKIPNGQMRTLKININSDPYKIANDFCKIYSIKDNVKQKLIKNIINCQNICLKNNINIYDDN